MLQDAGRLAPLLEPSVESWKKYISDWLTDTGSFQVSSIQWLPVSGQVPPHRVPWLAPGMLEQAGSSPEFMTAQLSHGEV
jgi:hypothetical protein